MPLSSQAICTEAASIAKAPGFTAQSGRALNLVLNDLCIHRDLKMLRQQESISVGAGNNGPFNLPANYLRTYDLFFTVNNFPFFLNPMSQEDYDALIKDPSISNYPAWYATDLTPVQVSGGIPTIKIWPQSNSAITLTHRYMINMADIASPESSATVPWFPDQDYLMHAVAERLMRITDDERRETFRKDCEDMLRTHLIMDGDEQKVVKSIRLDPQRFRVGNRIRPTKLNPY